MKHLLTATLIATALASPVRGDEHPSLIISVGDFFNHCNPSDYGEVLFGAEENYYLGACGGTVTAFFSMTATMCAFDMDIPSIFKADLLGNDVGDAQAMRVMWNWARDNTSNWELPIVAISQSLSEAWPCE